jgi:hypothetical protein
MGDKLTLSSERILHKDYDRKVYLQKKKKKKNSGREPQKIWLQGELIDVKPPVVE